MRAEDRVPRRQRILLEITSQFEGKCDHRGSVARCRDAPHCKRTQKNPTVQRQRTATDLIKVKCSQRNLAPLALDVRRLPLPSKDTFLALGFGRLAYQPECDRSPPGGEPFNGRLLRPDSEEATVMVVERRGRAIDDESGQLATGGARSSTEGGSLQSTARAG
jgi:hypothetical protein